MLVVMIRDAATESAGKPPLFVSADAGLIREIGDLVAKRLGARRLSSIRRDLSKADNPDNR